MEKDNRFLKGVLSGVVITILGIGLFAAVFIAVQKGLDSTGISDNQPSVAESGDTISGNDDIMDKIQEIKEVIDTYFLDTVDEEALIDGIYAGLVAGLDDPYSVYYNKEELAAMQESTSGEYHGIGATLTSDSETGIITIIMPFEGSPAAEAGILPGDILYKVEDEEVTGQDLSSVVAKIKGEEGTTVNLTLIRDGVAEPIEVSVVRRMIEVPTVDYEMLENKIGYIEVTEFSEVTADQFSEALADLEDQGMERLIIDLRNNPGGLLNTVCEMLNQILPEGIIVYTEDKNGNREEFTSDGENQFTKPLVLLTNGNSASASEIFAGAIKDYGIGTIVGTTTFGKGIVQRLIGLSDGTAVKLTISKYFTPNGYNIHGIGIEPDIEVDLSDEAKMAISLSLEDDSQLQKAIEVIMEK